MLRGIQLICGRRLDFLQIVQLVFLQKDTLNDIGLECKLAAGVGGAGGDQTALRVVKAEGCAGQGFARQRAGFGTQTWRFLWACRNLAWDLRSFIRFRRGSPAVSSSVLP